MELAEPIRSAGVRVLLLVTVVPCTVWSASAQSDLLMLETTLPPEADVWYQNHYGDSQPSGFEVPFGHVYSMPDTQATVLGTLKATARWDSYLHFGWVFEAAASREETVWREDVGDWGYGIDQFVADTVDGWVLLPPGPYGRKGWARLLNSVWSDGFNGEVRSVAGRLIDVGNIAGVRIGTGEEVSVTGTMFIESIEGDVVKFRPEVPSDMPCDPERESTPDPSVPEYRAAIKSFITEEGRPKFAIAYPKGC